MKLFELLFKCLPAIIIFVLISCTKPEESRLQPVGSLTDLDKNKFILSDLQIEHYSDSVSKDTDALEIARLVDEIFLDYWNKYKNLTKAEKEYISNKALTVYYDTVVKKLGLNESLFFRKLDTAALHYQKLYDKFFAVNKFDKLDYRNYWQIFNKAERKMNREKAIFITYGYIKPEKLETCIKNSSVTDALLFQSSSNIYFGLCHAKMENPNFKFEKLGIRYLGLQQAIACNYSKLIKFETCIGNDKIAF